MSEVVKVVVGLGNPGREYAGTRHNIGFMVLNQLAKQLSADGPKKRFRAEIVEATDRGEKMILVAPQTYMNLSGRSVREVVNWYHLPHEDLIVIADDLDLAFGTLRLRARGSAGGHNGLASIFQDLATQEITRLKIGIGRGPGSVVSRVLSRFSPDEERDLPDVIERSVGAVLQWAHDGVIATMNDVNRKDQPGSATVS